MRLRRRTISARPGSWPAGPGAAPQPASCMASWALRSRARVPPEHVAVWLYGGGGD